MCKQRYNKVKPQGVHIFLPLPLMFDRRSVMQCFALFFLLNTLTFTYIPSTVGCPDTGPRVEPSPEILPGTATVTWQAAQTSDPVLTTGMLYAVYSLCGSESSSYQLVAEAIEGLSYTVTGLPAPAQCALRVVAYHRYCLQDLDGVLRDETLPFTTAIAGK